MREELDHEAVRAELKAIIAKVDDRGSLLFTKWLLTRISKNQPIPPIDEVKALHDAFARVTAAFRAHRKVKAADLDLVNRWIGVEDVEIARPLADATKFYRAQKKMTRVELSRRCRFPLRAILQLERGQVKDMTLPRLQQLADGLRVELGEFMNKVAEFEKSSKG
jgi:DNA-binding Xre family transcriptional regulator